jgi:hypothetical protein
MLAVCLCIAVVASAWLETLLDVIDLLPATVVKSDVSGVINYKFPIGSSKIRMETLPVANLCQYVFQGPK